MTFTFTFTRIILSTEIKPYTLVSESTIAQSNSTREIKRFMSKYFNYTSNLQPTVLLYILSHDGKYLQLLAQSAFSVNIQTNRRNKHFALGEFSIK